MEIISKISKGSRMDQVYIPKNRTGFAVGDHVVIRLLEALQEKKPPEKLYFYGVKRLEPVKSGIIHEIMQIIEKSVANYENIFVTGSFLERGFQFNDIDILIISKNKINQEIIKENIERKTGIKTHILILNNKELSKGLETDPLYHMILNRCIAKKRFIYKTKQTINYKFLDLHLLKSKTLSDNFDILSGKEKYNLVRNTIAIYLYLKKNKVTIDSVDKEIKKALKVNSQEIKSNVLNKKAFLKKYALIYNKALAMILKGIEHGSKQK